MIRSRLLLTALLAAALSGGTAFAVCPTAGPAGGFFVIDLKSCAVGVTAGFTGVTFQPGGACAAVGRPASCPASPTTGWKQAALKIALPAGCTQANVTIEYEGTPCGFTADLGDSSTNDGFGGGAGGTTLSCAEAQVLNSPSAAGVGNPLSTLGVYSSCQGGVVDNLANASLALTNGSLKFTVKNQFVSWGEPAIVLQTPNVKRLFQLPDTLGPGADGSTLYLGLNRVISGPGGRIGYGARRAIISFQ
jgi:hypothetical protein